MRLVFSQLGSLLARGARLSGLGRGAWGWRGQLVILILFGSGAALLGSLELARADTPLLEATQVIGQPDFATSDLGTTSDHSLHPVATALDPVRHRLFVADLSAGQRVLVFGVDGESGAVDSSASHVIGQPDFTSEYHVDGPTPTVSDPTGIAFDAVNDRLFVSDAANCRVLVFDLSGGISDGMDASYALGASSIHDWGCFGDLDSQALLQDPGALAYDPASGLLYVADSGRGRVMVFDVDPGNLADGEDASYVIGQSDFDAQNADISRSGLSSPQALAVDSLHHRLFVADSFLDGPHSGNRVLVYDTSALSNGMDASFVLGQPDFTSTDGAGSNANSFLAAGLADDPYGERLFVEDQNIARVLIFDTTELSNGEEATGVIGESDPSSDGSSCESTSSTQLCSPSGSDDAYDPVQKQLYVSDGGNNRVLVFQPPGGVDPLADGPTGGAEISTCGTTPVFRAKAVSGSGVEYEFQVATDSSFDTGTIVADSGLIPGMNTYTPPPGSLAGGDSYYWRWKTAGGAWSTPRSFSIKIPHVGAGVGSGPLWSHGPLAVNEVSGNLLVSLPGPSYPSESGDLSASVSYNSQLSSDSGLGSGWLLDSGTSDSGPPLELVDHNLLDPSRRMDAVEAKFADGSSICFAHVADTGANGDPGEYVAGPGSEAELSRNSDGSFSYTDGGLLATYTVGTGATADPSSIQYLDASAGKGTLTYSFSTEDPSKVTSVSDDTGRSLSFTWNSLDPSGCSDAIVCLTGPDDVTWKYIGAGSGGTSGRLASVNDGTRTLFALSYHLGRVTKVRNANDLDPTNASPGYNGAHALTIDYDSDGRVNSVNDGPISNQRAPTTSTWTFAYHPGAASTTPTRADHGSVSAGTARTAAGYTTVTPPKQQQGPLPTGWAFDGQGTVSSPAFDWPSSVTGLDLSSGDESDPSTATTVTITPTSAFAWCVTGSYDPADRNAAQYDAWWGLNGDSEISASSEIAGPPRGERFGSLPLDVSSLSAGAQFFCLLVFRDDSGTYVGAASIASGQTAVTQFTYSTSAAACDDTSGENPPCTPTGWGYDGANSAASPGFDWPSSVTGVDLNSGDGADPSTATTITITPTYAYAICAIGPYDSGDLSADQYNAWWDINGDSIIGSSDSAIPPAAGKFSDSLAADVSGLAGEGGTQFFCALVFGDADGDTVGPSSIASGQTAVTQFTYATKTAACEDTTGGSEPCVTSAPTTVYYNNHGDAIEQDDALGRVTESGYNNRDQLLWSEDADGNPTDYSYNSGLNTDPSVADLLTREQDPDPDGSGPLTRPTTLYRYDETQAGSASSAGPALHGLQATYYDNPDLAGRPKLIQTDATVDDNWGDSGPSGLEAGSDYSVRWQGVLSVAETGDYVLSTGASDRTRLLIDGVDTIDNWTDQSLTTTSSAPITLSAGLHSLTLEYRDDSDPGEVHLRWSCSSCSPGITNQVIPTEALLPAWDNETSTISPQGRVSYSHYDQPWTGKPQYDLVTAPVNGTDSPLVASYSYDAYGHMTGKVMPGGNPTPAIDSTSGDLTNPADPVTSDYGTVYTYYAPTNTAAPPAACGSGDSVNQAGQLETKQAHGLHADTYVYDSAGDAIAATDAAGTTCSQYDGEGRLTSAQAASDSHATTYTYDPVGNTLSISHAGSGDDTAGTRSASYDEAGRVTDTVDAHGAEAAFSYDADGNEISRQAASGPLGSNTVYTTNYSYDAADELTSETDPAGNTYQFYYDNRGNLRGTQYPNDTFSWTDTNPDGWTTNLYNRHGSIDSTTTTAPADSSPLADFDYQYNEDGDKTVEQRTTGGSGSASTATTDYSYDSLGRLATVANPDDSAQRYCYDADSNRTAIISPSSGTCASGTATSTYTYVTGTDTPTDALTSQSGPTRTFAYEGAGTSLGDGMMTGRGSDTLRYDGLQRLQSATVDGKTACYSYSPDGSLATRVYDESGSSTCTSPTSTTNYLLNDLFETNGAGTIITSYIDGPAGDLASYAGAPDGDSAVSYLYYDGHGDLAAEADSSGARTADHTYDPFGVPMDSVPGNVTAHRFVGRWNKQYDTTTGLILMGARPYDPGLGRFLAVDPVDGGSLNNYDYAGQDPINDYDLTGTMHGEGSDKSGDCGRATGKALESCVFHTGTYEAFCALWPKSGACKSDFHPFSGRVTSCTLLAVGLFSGGSELYEAYRGIRAGKDAVDLAIEFGKRYLGKARKNQLHIGGFSAGVTASALTGGCLP